MSIFDSDCMLFYLMKYSEIIGVEALIAHASHEKTLEYSEKLKIVEFIIKQECELGVEESSWKHCLLYMLMTGTLHESKFRELFDF